MPRLVLAMIFQHTNFVLSSFTMSSRLGSVLFVSFSVYTLIFWVSLAIIWVCVVTRLVILIELRLVMDRQTDTACVTLALRHAVKINELS